MEGLLDNFLSPLKLFLGCGERFHEIVMTENGGGKERKIISYGKSNERWVERAEA
jgi:hypothetical protein